MDSVCRRLRAYAQTPWIREDIIRENLAWEQRSLEERKRRYRRILEDMTLMQDIFMRNAFQDRACVEYLLQVILEKKDLKVESHTIQADYKNLYGHSAFLDCVACDAQNRRYNVEIQQEAFPSTISAARWRKLGKSLGTKRTSCM